MKIAMMGTGYVGLVSGACFSEFGHHVVCVDKDEAKIEALKAGRVPIYEPGLAEVVADNVRAGRLSFTMEVESSVREADAVFIAVGNSIATRRRPCRSFLCVRGGRRDRGGAGRLHRRHNKIDRPRRDRT